MGVSPWTCSSGVITLIGKSEHLGPSDDLLGMWRYLASQVYAPGYRRGLCTVFFFCFSEPDEDAWSEKGVSCGLGRLEQERCGCLTTTASQMVWVYDLS